MRAFRRFVSMVMVAAGLGYVGPSSAVIITFQATDLTDVSSPPGDLWKYTYTVVDGSFAQFGGFNIFFSPDLYRNLQNPATANVGWLVSTVQPDPALPASGFLSAQALVANPSIAGIFTVEFVWLGGPRTPGEQAFAVLDDTFNPIPGAGEFTQVPGLQVPLPGTLALLASGMLALGVRRAIHATQRDH
jgi:hypothetical protein